FGQKSGKVNLNLTMMSIDSLYRSLAFYFPIGSLSIQQSTLETSRRKNRSTFAHNSLDLFNRLTAIFLNSSGKLFVLSRVRLRVVFCAPGRKFKIVGIISIPFSVSR